MNEVPQILMVLDWYDFRIHHGVVNFSREKGWHLFCLNQVSGSIGTPMPEKLPIGSLKFDGAISFIHTPTTARFFQNNRIPVVNLGAEDFGLKVPNVITDNKAIGEIAAEHFLERGFTNFYVPRHMKVKMYYERYESFSNYLKKNGADECHFMPGSALSFSSSPTHFLNQSVSWWKERLKDLRFPAALFTYEDNMASKWLMLAKHMGIGVPDQLAILGVDNNPLIVEAMDPSLSSIETDQEGLGYAAAKLLSDILDGKEKMVKKTFYHDPISVVTRRSTDTIASKNPLVSKALALIHENLKINASELADRLGITQQGLQQAFRFHFHLSPAETIRHLRIREIKHLLKDKKIKISTITKTTGFSSKISLSQFFKRETGITPGQYRKSHQ